MNLKGQSERIKLEARALAIIETQEGIVERARENEASAIADREKKEQLLSKIQQLSAEKIIELTESVKAERIYRGIDGMHSSPDIERLAKALGGHHE
jgi:hypothetical protein